MALSTSTNGYLRKAHDDLRRKVGEIKDEEARAGFLSVGRNHKILEEWAKRARTPGHG